MGKKKLIYFGSPDFAGQILESLLTDKTIDVVGVVTQPDKLLGRQQILTSSPVAQIAEKHELPVFKPEKLDDNNLSHIKLLKPDIFLVVAYGKIMPQTWLKTPTLKTLNIHFSLLPKYRGALCVSEALKNGDDETGVTLMEMEQKLDAGPIISKVSIKIDPNDNVATLTNRLAESAKTLLRYELPIYLDGAVAAKHQDESEAILTPSFKTHTHQNAFIEFDRIQAAIDGENAWDTHNLVRSLIPEPGPWTKIKNHELKIIKESFSNQKLVLEIVQEPGKQPVSWQQLKNKYSL